MLGRSADAEDAEDAEIAELRGLLAMANSAEQVGYYSDFDPDSGSWSSRGGVTEPEFAKVRTLIGDYATETQRQFDEFTRYRATAGQAPATT